MRFFAILFPILLLVATVASAQSAATTQAPQVPSVVALLTPEHVYTLLVYSILGSLGVLGLLLGLDKLLIALFRFGANADQFKKYSSESIARILPIVIEGITVILVILTVIILGVSRIISAEGTLGILGSIVGYVLGKSTGKATTPTTSPDQPDPSGR